MPSSCGLCIESDSIISDNRAAPFTFMTFILYKIRSRQYKRSTLNANTLGVNSKVSEVKKMKFLSTVFFVVLTIGIPNVHAAWEAEREPLHRCFVTFFGRMYNYSIKMNLLQGAQIEESNFGQELRTKFGYSTTFANYEFFAKDTLLVLKMILEPFEKHPFGTEDGGVVSYIRAIVSKFADCINSNPNLKQYHNIPAPFNEKLFEFYCNSLLKRMKQALRPRKFTADSTLKEDSLSKPGTSSEPQGQAAPTGKWVINDDCGYLTVGPRAPQQITEQNWWLYDLLNLDTNQDG